MIKLNLQKRINYLSRGLNYNIDLDEFIAIEETINTAYNKKENNNEKEKKELEEILDLCQKTKELIIKNYNTRKKAELLNYPEGNKNNE